MSSTAMAANHSRFDAPCDCSGDETRVISTARSVAMSSNVANTMRKEMQNLSGIDPFSKNELLLPKVILRKTAYSHMSSSTCSHILPMQEDNIVSGIIFSKWDDIMGPQTIHVWLKDDSTSQEALGERHNICHHEANIPLMKSIKYVTGHTVNYMGVTTVSPEMPTSQAFNERNATLFIVPDLNLVAQAIVFNLRDRGLDVPHALSMMVHYKYYKYYLNIHQLCCLWLRRISSRLHQLLISGTVSLEKEFVTYEGVNQWMCDFNSMLISLQTCQLHPQVYDKHILSNSTFIERAIISHLQTLGCTVIMGTSVTEINVFIKFLALFLEKEELVCSRLVLPEYRYSFHMGLFLQGLLLDEYGCRELSSEELSSNPCPVSAIDLTRKTNVSAVKQSTRGRNTFLAWRNHSMLTTMKEGGSRLVRELIADFKLLPTEQWPHLAKSFITKTHALSQLLVNYIDNNGADSTWRNSAELQKHFNLIMNLEDADFLIVLSRAEKLREGITLEMFSKLR